MSPFQKWYKKTYLGISDFSMLQACAAWNLSVDEFQNKGRGGQVWRNKLKKWQFSAVAAEEMMHYTEHVVM